MRTGTIPLVFITDKNYVLPTAVAMTSVVKNKRATSSYEFIIFATALSQDDKQKLVTTASGLPIRFVDFDTQKYQNIVCKTHVSVAALCKFEIANILSDYDKVLYLDGDIIVQDDLSDLFNTDINDYYVGAVKDAYVLQEKKQTLGVDGYFNSGVMLLNCELMRRDNMAQKLWELKTLNRDLLFMDQDVFNLAFSGNVKYLDFRYNFMAAYFRKKYHAFLTDIYADGHYVNEQCSYPAIIHYTGKNPWQYYHRIGAEIWRKYYALSVFSNHQLQYKDTWKMKIRKLLPFRKEREDGKVEIFWMKHRLFAYWNRNSKYQKLWAKRFDDDLSLEDKKYILTVQLAKVTDYKPNLDDPKTFVEKIQWLKLHYHNPLLTQCADKYAVRQYVKDKIGAEYLVPLLGVWDDPADIDFDALPEQFVLKVNWGSGQNIIVKDKTKINRKNAVSKLRDWMKSHHNHYYHSFEWAYKNITPKVVAEKLLLLDEGPIEYKMFCFDGKFKFALLEINWNTPQHCRAFCDENYNEVNFVIGNYQHSSLPKKSNEFELMRNLAQKLAEKFPAVRVDFYNVKGKIYFGEMTFYSGSGYSIIKPEEYNFKLGDWLRLPEPK